MTRALALSAILACAPACAQAVQHPVPSLAVVGGAIGFGTCEMDGIGVGTCGIIGASTAVFMGGVAAIVYLLTDQPPPQMEGEEIDPTERARPRHHAPIILPPPPDEPAPPGAPPGATPVTIDAGVLSADATAPLPDPPAP